MWQKTIQNICELLCVADTIYVYTIHGCINVLR